MQRIDRWLGLALALLGIAVVWTARDFPVVPGQKVGAGFLPTLAGLGLVVAAVALVLRSRRAPPADATRAAERLGSPMVVVAVVVGYIVGAERLGFLIVAPIGLAVLFRTFGVGWRAAVLWALGGTVLVHVAFYKLLRVPLPWGLLRPFY